MEFYKCNSILHLSFIFRSFPIFLLSFLALFTLINHPLLLLLLLLLFLFLLLLLAPKLLNKRKQKRLNPIKLLQEILLQPNLHKKWQSILAIQSITKDIHGLQKLWGP